MANPFPTSTRAPGGWLGFWVGILVTVGIVAALVQLWPDDDPRTIGSSAPVTPTTRAGVPELPEGFPDITDLTAPVVPDGPTAQLFTSGAPEAVAEVLAAAGSPVQLYEVALYETYLFVTLSTPTARAQRWSWRDGRVTADDRSVPVAPSEAEAFAPGDVDLALIPALAQDATQRYGEPVRVTHILIDRFLPFDERVLVRVYASPPDNPSGGGYVSYTGDGTFVSVCC